MAVTVNVGSATVDPSTGAVTALTGLAGALFQASITAALAAGNATGNSVLDSGLLGFHLGIVVLNSPYPYYARGRYAAATIAQLTAQAIADNIS